MRGLASDKATITTNISVDPGLRGLEIEEVKQMTGKQVGELAKRYYKHRYAGYNGRTDVLASYIIWLLADRHGLEMQFDKTGRGQRPT